VNGTGFDWDLHSEDFPLRVGSFGGLLPGDFIYFLGSGESRLVGEEVGSEVVEGPAVS
jgi:hypothetical protein